MRFMSAFMNIALEEAERAAQAGEVPVGAVVVKDGHVIAKAHNRVLQDKDPSAHAELLAIKSAAQVLSNERLNGCDLYVTLEPCPMCAGAIVQARIPRIVYGTDDPKAGACISLYQITSDNRLNHQSLVTAGVMQAECRRILQDFFAEQRAQGKK